MSDLPPQPFKGQTGWRRIVAAAGYSLAGLRAAWTGEAAFRQVCTLALLGLALLVWLQLPLLYCALIVFAHLFSVVVELVNSAIEAAVDHTSLAPHPLAKRAKDLASAAQAISLLNIAAMWLLALLA